MRIGKKSLALGAVVLAFAGVMVVAQSASAVTPPVSATTHVTNRHDNGLGGFWALDAFDRTLTVTQEHEVDAASCPQVIKLEVLRLKQPKCWLYTAKVEDSGTFVTLDALSPHAKVTNTAGLNGTMTGSVTYSFYTTHLVDESLVPATVSGDVPGRSKWYQTAFQPGTVFSGGIKTWGWKYEAPTCDGTQVMTDSSANSVNTGNEFVGDILTSLAKNCPTLTETPVPTDTPSPSSSPVPSSSTTTPPPSVVTIPVTGTSVSFTG